MRDGPGVASWEPAWLMLSTDPPTRGSDSCSCCPIDLDTRRHPPKMPGSHLYSSKLSWHGNKFKVKVK